MLGKTRLFSNHVGLQTFSLLCPLGLSQGWYHVFLKLFDHYFFLPQRIISYISFQDWMDKYEETLCLPWLRTHSFHPITRICLELTFQPATGNREKSQKSCDLTAFNSL